MLWSFSYHTRWEELSLPKCASDGILTLLAPRSLAPRIPLSTLSDDERERCHRFHFVADRERFLVAHALKRRCLAALVKRPADRLAFATTAEGKPVLVDTAIQFNLSHSGDWAVLALSGNAPVGIDVEFPDRIQRSLPAELVYHPDDRIAGEPGSAAERFFTVWTLKEAMAKSLGLGLGLAFPTLRLEPHTTGWYHGAHPHGVCWGRHGRLHDSSHLAIAGLERWDSESLILVT